MATATASPATLARQALRAGDFWPLLARFIAYEQGHADGLAAVPLAEIARCTQTSPAALVADLVDGAGRCAGLGLHLGTGPEDMIVYHRTQPDAAGADPNAMIGAHVFGKQRINRLPMPEAIDTLHEWADGINRDWQPDGDEDAAADGQAVDPHAETDRIPRRPVKSDTVRIVQETRRRALELQRLADRLEVGRMPMERKLREDDARTVRLAVGLLNQCAALVEGAA